MIKKRLTIMVPALNEERSLKNTIAEIKKGLKGLKNHEILIFNDGSSDKTKVVAEQLVKRDKKIKVINNTANRGVGYCYRTGQKLAKFDYYMYIPGDNQFPAQALSLLTNKIGQADIIIPFVTNMNIRPLMRQFISSTYTHLLNFLFGLNITYYNAPVIHNLKILRKIPQNPNSGHAYQSEILIRALKSGASYIEIGYEMYERKGGRTAAFKWTNAVRVLSTVMALFWQLQILKKRPLT